MVVGVDGGTRGRRHRRLVVIVMNSLHKYYDSCPQPQISRTVPVLNSAH